MFKFALNGKPILYRIFFWDFFGSFCNIVAISYKRVFEMQKYAFSFFHQNIEHWHQQQMCIPAQWENYLINLYSCSVFDDSVIYQNKQINTQRKSTSL